VPTTRWNKIKTPVNSDAWNLAADLASMADSTGATIPVASQAERDGLVSLAPGGVLPIPTTVFRSDLGYTETWDGTAWIPNGASANIVTFGTGWSPFSGTHQPRVVRQGKMVYLFGLVSSSSGASISNICTIPAAFQPPSGNTRFVGGVITSLGTTATLSLGVGVIAVPAGYGSINMSGNPSVPLLGQWVMD